MFMASQDLHRILLYISSLSLFLYILTHTHASAARARIDPCVRHPEGVFMMFMMGQEDVSRTEPMELHQKTAWP